MFGKAYQNTRIDTTTPGRDTMAVGDIFQSQFGYSVNGRSCSNVTFWEQLDQPTISDESADLANAIAKDILPEFQAMMSDEAQLCFIKVWAITADLPPSFNLLPTTDGTVVSPAAPANKNAKFIFRQSAISSRSNGELRLSGIPESDTDGNSYIGNVTHAAAVAALIGHFTADITSSAPASGRYRLKIKSLTTIPPDPAGTPHYFDVTAANLSTLVHSDRRRTSRHQSLSV